MLSSRKKPNSWRDVGVGLFVVVGIAIIAAAILFFQPGQHFGSTVRARTLFASVRGLTIGMPVMMSGVQIGSVTDIQFLSPAAIKQVSLNAIPLSELDALKHKMDMLNVKIPAQESEYQKLLQQYADIQASLKHVRVEMSVSSSYVPYLRKDSVATLKSEGLVGEKEVDISMGTPSAPAQVPVLGENNEMAYEVQSQEGPDFNQMLAKASSATNALNTVMVEIADDIKNGKGTLGEIIKNKDLYVNMENFLNSSARATRYTGDLLNSVRQGKGTVGKIFTDPSLYNNAEGLVSGLRSGNGTFGQLITNPSLYNNGNQLVEQMHGIMNKVNSGNGTLHNLIANPSLYNKTNEVMTNLSQLTQDLNQGKGSLGKLAKDEAFYNNATHAMSNLAAISNEIQNGQGSLGLLIKDKTLYQNVTALSGEMVKFMRDFQKNPRKYLTVQFSVVKIF